jgi:hypothetical protein
MDVSTALDVLWRYLAAGGVGFALGCWWMWRRFVRHRNEKGIVRIYALIGAMSALTVGMAIALVIVSIQVGVAKQNNVASKESVAIANAQIDVLKRQTRDNEVQSDCQQVALEDLIASLLPRASFAEQEVAVQLAYAQRQLVFLVEVRSPGGASASTLDDLIEAERARIKALRELLGQTATQDLPNLSEIEKCRN